jgi:hypothetical protein
MTPIEVPDSAPRRRVPRGLVGTLIFFVLLAIVGAALWLVFALSLAHLKLWGT